MKSLSLAVLMVLFIGSGCQNPEQIKAFCLDVNWRIKTDRSKDHLNNFAPPGAWSDLDPAAHVAWCKELGANVIQSFAVSCNGYAWYKGGKIPEQPGLETDFLPELVKLGRKENMKVFGYFCVGSNTRWGLENPELSYETPNRPHIPFTKSYNRFLSESIKEALLVTDMDGFMIDWLQNEAGDKESIDLVRSQIGEHTRLITTFSANFFNRNNLKGEEVAAYALKDNIGLYCYASPKSYDYTFPPVKDYLSTPLDSYTDLDERNIAVLARVFNNLSFK